MLLLPDLLTKAFSGAGAAALEMGQSLLLFFALIFAGYTVVFIAAEAFMFTCAKVSARWKHS